MHEGRWNGRQVIPARWVRESLRRHVAIDTAGGTGYGYQWWIRRVPTASGALDVPTAIGNGQQRIFVLREKGMVVTMLAGRYNDRTGARLAHDLLVEQVLPAVR